MSQPEETYLLLTKSGNPYLKGAPLDALLVPGKDDLLLAAGHEGVVLLHPDGTWQAIAVGQYEQDALQKAGLAGYLVLLWADALWAALAGLIWLGASGLHRWKRWWLVVVIAALLALLGSLLSLFPEISASSYTAVAPLLALLVTALFSLALLIGAAVRRRWGIFRQLPAALLLALAAFTPFLLWALNVLPAFYWAVLIAGLAAFGAIFVLPAWKEEREEKEIRR